MTMIQKENEKNKEVYMTPVRTRIRNEGEITKLRGTKTAALDKVNVILHTSSRKI